MDNRHLEIFIHGVVICLSISSCISHSTVEPPEFEGTCPMPAIPASRITGTRAIKYTVGSRTEITCNANYRFVHAPTATIHLVCNADGTWSDALGNSLLACERIGECSTPNIANGGFLIPKSSSYSPGETALVQCEPGYSFNDSAVAVIKCDIDGVWKGERNSALLPQCIVKLCDKPSEVIHAHMKQDPADGRSEGAKVSYVCNPGYTSVSNENHVVKCKNGQWVGQLPTCVKTGNGSSCREPEDIQNSYKNVYGPGMDPAKTPDLKTYAENWKVLYFCNVGYTNISPRATLTCLNGQWQGERPQCVKTCQDPPPLQNGDFHIVGKNDKHDNSEVYVEGSQVIYSCKTGFTGRNDAKIAVMICQDREWRGYKPQCVRRQYCDKPQDIEYGNWLILTEDPGSASFSIGTKIMYECNKGYKRIGSGVLSCLSTGYWSASAPKCVDEQNYCSDPDSVTNGYYMCKPSPCGLHKIGTEVHYMCYEGYTPVSGQDLVRTCKAGGQWAGHAPACQHADKKGAVGNIVNINASTMTVVIATSSGVLGLLILVMVVVALQRRMKPRALCPPCPAVHAPPTPQYPEPRGATVDEHDRVALIAFADGQHGVSVVLPSYEEATRGRVGPRLSRFNSDASSHSSSGRSSRGDYRPLPSIPHGLRGGGAPPDYPRDHHRNSIITTASTTTRDNLSLAFGSMDTVNVSDGTSASVTVDTYDSMASNPSIAPSQRATAGSIESSSTHGSFANDDAPLLDGVYTNTDTMRSQGSRSMESYTNTDTLRSQTHSESSAIAEVPDENKEQDE